MTFQKNQIYTVKIEDIGTEGEGIGKVDGFSLFVKDALPGDVARVRLTKVKKTYAYARLEEVLTPSPDRVDAPCPFHRQCGGCQIQALSYEKQLAFKQSKVENNLIRIGGFPAEMIKGIMEPVIGMEEPWHYRNKAQYPFGYGKDGEIVTGFYAGRTHTIIANTDCLLGAPENREILEIMLDHMKRYQVPAYREETGEGLVRHVLIRKGFATGELMVCLVINGKKLPGKEALIEKLSRIPNMTSLSYSINQKNTNVIMGEEIQLLWGSGTIEDRIGDISFLISPLSFYQVNPVQTKRLYELAVEYASLKGNETVWDLYCGIGTISLFMAKGARQVCGVEIIPQAIEDAKVNAARNNIRNVQFFAGKAEEVLPEKYTRDHIRADVIVVDPPRKGCDEKCLQTMLAMKPEWIVYVSCNSATLARDLKVLA